MKTLIRNGTVVNSNSSNKVDVLIQEGKIIAVAENGSLHNSLDETTTIIDASGKYILPGGVDPHCHIGFTSGQFTSMDNYEEATRGAVCGGTTTILDFAIPEKKETPISAMYRQKSRIQNAFCDTAMHGCIINFDRNIDKTIREFESNGIRTIKMFTTYRDELMANVETLMQVMKSLLNIGGLMYVHCEADHIVSENQFVALHNNRIGSSFHHQTRSELAEAISVADLLAIAETLGAPIYFVHQSCRQAVDQVASAKSIGRKAFSETVLHHVMLDDYHYNSDYPERFVCCPPLRSKETVASLLKVLINGDTDTLGSDHCSYNLYQKELLKHDVRYMPNGLPGVETRIPIGLSRLVIDGGLPIERFVAISSTNPAKLNGLYPKKGIIAPGSDADMAIWDLDSTYTMSASNLHMATDYTPYEGFTIKAQHIATYVRGTLVAENSQPIEQNKIGQFVPAGTIDFNVV